MMYIVTQLMTKKEKKELSDIFVALDKNGDGTLTYDELLEGYKKLYKSDERAKAEVKYLMAAADVDNNGTIDYSGTSPQDNRAGRVSAGIGEQETAAVADKREASIRHVRYCMTTLQPGVGQKRVDLAG